MAKPQSGVTVTYNPWRVPPRQTWTVPVDVPRNSVGTFCERVHLLVAERYGACFFFPDTQTNRNTCRFEWHRAWKRDRFGLRLGLSFVVDDAPLTQLEAYWTTRDLINAEDWVDPRIDTRTAAAIASDIAQTVEFGLTGKTADKNEEWLIAVNISVPHGRGFPQSTDAGGGRFRLIRTRIVARDLSRVSALIVRCEARSAQAASQNAGKDAMSALALLTLSEGRKYELAPLRWPKSRPFRSALRASKPVDEVRLFPPGRYLDTLETTDSNVASRFDELWSAYEQLPELERDVFMPALLAYYAAVDSSSNSATISTVGYFAALGALSRARRRQCPGTLSCSVHGVLPWRHDETSESRAIFETVVTSCDIVKADQRTRVKKLIDRVYREQRSAYVHGAELRHAEYNQSAQVPPAMPSNLGPTGELFVFQEDLLSIADIARRTLVEWLFKRVGRPLDRDKMNIRTDGVVVSARWAMSASLAPRVMTIFGPAPGASVDGETSADGSGRGKAGIGR